MTQCHIGLIATAPDACKVSLEAKIKTGASKLLPVESLTELLGVLTELWGYRAEVDVLFKEKPIGACMDWVDKNGNQLASALRALGSLREQVEAMRKHGKAEKAYDKIFEHLNVRFINQADFPGPEVEDKWRKELAMNCDDLRKALAKYLVGGH
jgi:hypothetical protein